MAKQYDRLISWLLLYFITIISTAYFVTLSLGYYFIHQTKIESVRCRRWWTDTFWDTLWHLLYTIVFIYIYTVFIVYLHLYSQDFIKLLKAILPYIVPAFTRIYFMQYHKWLEVVTRHSMNTNEKLIHIRH